MDNNFSDAEIHHIISSGGVIAYPTEAVFGLGCDPFNESAVKKILSIKRRDMSKGLILIASDWKQIADLVADISPTIIEKVKASWPGHITWLLPASAKAPAWIRGDSKYIALRVTAHPIASKLCQACAMPLVSTSANLSGEPALTSYEAVQHTLGDQISAIIPGNVDTTLKPSIIKDALTDTIIRG